MAANEKFRNYKTRYCAFAIDTEDDLVNLPTTKRRGLKEMALCNPCSQGSIATTTNGIRYTLSGNDNWVISTASSGGGVDNVESISSETLHSLFG